MGDFLLDLRPRGQRDMAGAAVALSFCDGLHVTLIEEEEFSLILTSPDDPQLWGGWRSADGNFLVALCGRVAFDQPEWDAARQVPGEGGLACKAIFNLYNTQGLNAFGALNGNFAIFLLDRKERRCCLATDRCGMLLAYHRTPLDEARVFSSHPDALASAVAEDQNLDLVSLAEFLATGRLTFPHTYYQNVRGLDTGCVHVFSFRGGSACYESRQACFKFEFKIDPAETQDDLAERLAAAFSKAIKRRTLPLLGRITVGLSGGLDSRLILSAAGPSQQIQAFNLFDEENAEFNTARKLAEACRVELTPIKRDFDYYANSAELGVRISGGTGCFASNHFLGIRDRFRQMGVQNLVTGCYCDYLFKGLALNTTEQKLTRIERVNRFNFEFYRPCFNLGTAYQAEVHNRQAALFPESRKQELGEEEWLEVERKRSFPLAYEADLAQRVIPQRVIPWYLPIVDNDLIDAYLRIPSHFKLNAALFKKALLLLCDDKVRRIPDSNTGAAVDTSRSRHSIHRYLTALRNRVSEKLLPRMATRGSWPNWHYYVRHSSVLEALWRRPNESAREILIHLIGRDPFAQPVSAFCGRELEFFLRLLTLKLWLDQRARLPLPVPIGRS